MKKIICILLCVLFLLPMSACATPKPVTREFYFMDTLITVTLYTTEQEAEPIFTQCRTILSELDALWSRTKTESDTARLNASEGGISDLDARTVELIRIATDVSKHTDGAFDITVSPLVTLWQTCADADRLPTEAELAAALDAVSYDSLSMSAEGEILKEAGTAIDLGGIGKGAAISALMRYLEGTEVSGALVSFGSNVAVLGEKPDGEPYRIGLRDPFGGTDYAGVLTLREGEILSVSGDYERYHTIGGKRYHHIFDPATGYPSDSGLSTVAVICRDGALADALSTALFVMGEVRAMELYDANVYDFEAIFITSDGAVHTTGGIADRFTTE
ncbi:MAG: FAD:protein FMN transferase [Clostridia bacterium]|nr:FAD:protein FMN transferase [Clostridia bacterium]